MLAASAAHVTLVKSASFWCFHLDKSCELQKSSKDLETAQAQVEKGKASVATAETHLGNVTGQPTQKLFALSWSF